MPRQAWTQGLAQQTTAGANFASFTTAKTVINQEALLPIGANTLKVGDAFTVTIEGALSSIVTTPGTITFQVMMGSVVAWTSGAIQLNASAHTSLPFKLVVDLSVQAVNTQATGATAKFAGFGTLTGVHFSAGSTTSTDSWGVTPAPAAAAVSHASLIVPVTAPALGTGFDSTATSNLDFWVGFSISNAGNNVTIWNYRVDGCN